MGKSLTVGYRGKEQGEAGWIDMGCTLGHQGMSLVVWYLPPWIRTEKRDLV